ncbi:hypothetical protein [Apibacter sp. HY039]|uniref:hypothetical protein n=1 Tax=Apibacter sp. HY039 TaxID=2501476 RepID=UPI000FEBA535|nr:hypothetical protein [Apibacter sp. HY039]
MKTENYPHIERLQKLERTLLEYIEEYSPFYEDMVNYDYVHYNLVSLLEVSQKCLFLEEDILRDDMKIHIYNLLEIAKAMLDKDEHDFLNQLATYARAYGEVKDYIKKNS